MDTETFNDWLATTFEAGPIGADGCRSVRMTGGPIPYYRRTLEAWQVRLLIARLNRLLHKHEPARNECMLPCMCGTEGHVEHYHAIGCPVRAVGGEA